MNLEHGKPMIFGKDKNKGIRLKGFSPEIVEFEAGKPPHDLLVHDEGAPNPTLAHILAQLERPSFPVPQGIFRSIGRPTLHQLMDQQIVHAKKTAEPDLQKLLKGPETWVVQ